MPDCLNCGTELEFDESLDQYTDNDDVILYEIGHCPCCGKSFKWKDNYKFTKYSDLEED